MIHCNKIVFTLSFWIVISLSASAQPIRLNHNVFFSKNKFELNEKELVKLDSLANRLTELDGEYKIFIRGYTDADADSIYNMRLSEKRCVAVKNGLANFGIDTNNVVFKAYGEHSPLLPNIDEINKSKNRRVEIFITYEKRVVTTINLPADTCSTDTIVDIGFGVFASFNRCEFLENRGCYKINYHKTVTCVYKCSRIKRWLRFKKPCKCKEPIVSFRFNVLSCKDSCFKHPITLYFPAYYFKNMRIYKNYEEKIKNGRRPSYFFKRKRIEKVNYETITVNCPGGGGMNCGGVRCKDDLVKVKLKNKLTFRNDSTDSYYFENKKHNMRFYSVYDLPDIKIYNPKTGDSTRLEYVPITKLRPGILRAKNYCGERKFLFIRYFSRHDYKRKYKIKSKDILKMKLAPDYGIYDTEEYINWE